MVQPPLGDQVKDADVAQMRHRRAGVVLLGADDAERRREAGVEKHRAGQAHRPQHFGEHVIAVAPRFRRDLQMKAASRSLSDAVPRKYQLPPNASTDGPARRKTNRRRVK